MNVRGHVTLVLWNFLMLALVFLPVFMVGGRVELSLRGAPPLDGQLAEILGGAVILYIGMLPPLLPGFLAHSIGMMLLPSAWPIRQRRLAAVALAILVPGTAVVLDLSGATVLSDLLGATAFSTLAYSLCTSFRLR